MKGHTKQKISKKINWKKKIRDNQKIMEKKRKISWSYKKEIRKKKKKKRNEKKNKIKKKSTKKIEKKQKQKKINR